MWQPKTIVCKICGESFIQNIHNQKYCSKKCKNKVDNTKKDRSKYERKKENTFTYICANCGKELKDRYKSKSKNNFCDAKCSTKYYRSLNEKTTKCLICNKTFKPKNKAHKYCSKECKKSYKKVSGAIYTYKCDNCNIEFDTKNKKHGKNTFCCHKCSAEYVSKFLFGENAGTYNHNYTIEDRTVICECCGKSFAVFPKAVAKSRFCSQRCFIISGSRMSNPQKLINVLLDNEGIEYRNEYKVGRFSMDNYLTDSGLFIEVMGNFWHCNSTIYKEILYNSQKECVIKDKRKRTFTFDKHGVEILYLWEEDIINNIDICKELILSYIKNKGIISDYHSFNYNIRNNGLEINKEIITPYMEYNNDDILKLYKKS